VRVRNRFGVKKARVNVQAAENPGATTPPSLQSLRVGGWRQLTSGVQGTTRAQAKHVAGGERGRRKGSPGPRPRRTSACGAPSSASAVKKLGEKGKKKDGSRKNQGKRREKAISAPRRHPRASPSPGKIGRSGGKKAEQLKGFAGKKRNVGGPELSGFFPSRIGERKFKTCGECTRDPQKQAGVKTKPPYSRNTPKKKKNTENSSAKKGAIRLSKQLGVLIEGTKKLLRSAFVSERKNGKPPRGGKGGPKSGKTLLWQVQKPEMVRGLLQRGAAKGLLE